MIMAKIVTLSNVHSNFHGKNLFIELQGGSPWFGYVWIDDVCYTIVKTARGYKLQKSKL
jgi:hypothetical protein